MSCLRGSGAPDRHCTVAFSPEVGNGPYDDEDGCDLRKFVEEPRPLDNAWSDTPPTVDDISLFGLAKARCSALIAAAVLEHDVSEALWPVFWPKPYDSDDTARLYLPCFDELDAEAEDAGDNPRS